MTRISAQNLVKDKEYIFFDCPTQHSYRAIYMGIYKEAREDSDYNVHKFRVFPRTVLLNKPFTLRLLECEINEALDAWITEVEVDSKWN